MNGCGIERHCRLELKIALTPSVAVAVYGYSAITMDLLGWAAVSKLSSARWLLSGTFRQIIDNSDRQNHIHIGRIMCADGLAITTDDPVMGMQWWPVTRYTHRSNTHGKTGCCFMQNWYQHRLFVRAIRNLTIFSRIMCRTKDGGYLIEPQIMLES